MSGFDDVTERMHICGEGEAEVGELRDGKEVLNTPGDSTEKMNFQ